MITHANQKLGIRTLTHVGHGARSNIILQSQVLGTTWTTNRASISSNAVEAPDGSITAEKLTEDNTAGATHNIGQVVAASAVAYTFSIHAKAAERTRFLLFATTASKGYGFDLSAGTPLAVTGISAPTNWGMVPAGNGWYRCFVTMTQGASSPTWSVYLVTNTTTSYNGDNASGLYLWGAQLETGNIMSPYIPTTTAAVTEYF
jgi:hypothetical protein